MTASVEIISDIITNTKNAADGRISLSVSKSGFCITGEYPITESQANDFKTKYSMIFGNNFVFKYNLQNKPNDNWLYNRYFY